MKNSQNVGKKIKLARVQADLTQRGLGKKIGKSGAAIAYMEQGKRGISTEILKDIAVATGKELSFFYGQEENAIQVDKSLSDLTDQLAELKTLFKKAEGEKEKAELDAIAFKLGIERSGDVIFLTDKEGLFTYVNKAFEDLYGFSSKEVLGKKTPRILKSGFETAQFYVEFWTALMGNEIFSSEIVNKGKDGSLYTISISANPILDNKGEISGFLAVQRNITEQKKAQEELFQSRETLALALGFGDIGSWVWNIATNELEWSDMVYDIWGVDKKSKPAFEDFTDSIHPEDKKMVIEAINISLELKKQYNAEYRIILPDNSVKTVCAKGMPVCDETGKAIKMLGVVYDITEKKRAEETLRQFETIVSNSKDMEALLDKNFVYLAINATYAEGFGKKPKEMIGKSVAEVFGEDFFNQAIKPHADECLKGHEVQYSAWFDFPVYGKKHMEINYYPYFGANKEVIGFVVNGRDGTDRKKIEVEKENLLEVIKISKEAINISSSDASIIYTNEAFNKLFGYKKGELIGRNVSILNSPKTSASLIKEVFEALENKGYWEGELNNKRKDGSEFIGYATVSANKDKDGNITNIIAAQCDITKRKEAEEKLKESERSLKKAQELGQIGSWKWDAKTDKGEWSDQIYKIFGFKVGEIDVTFEFLLKRMHLDDREWVAKGIEEAVISQKPIDMEYRVYRKDGSLCVVHSVAEVTLDESGVTIGMIGILQDITEQKKIEEQLRESAAVVSQSYRGRLKKGKKRESEKMKKV